MSVEDICQKASCWLPDVQRLHWYILKVSTKLSQCVHRTTSPDAHTRTFSRANTTAHHPHTSSVGTPHWLKAQCSRSNESRVIHSVSHPSRSVMSLLNVPYRPFPRVLSSPSAQSSRPSVSTTPIARGRRNSPRRPLAGVSLAEWLTQLQTDTGYEPKLANFFSYVDPEHTPINTPDSHHNFLCPDDATMIHHQSRSFTEFRSIQQQQANSS